jgi:hypothetical protein
VLFWNRVPGLVIGSAAAIIVLFATLFVGFGGDERTSTRMNGRVQRWLRNSPRIAD